MKISTANNITIYYDGGCPFCARYVAYLNIKKTFGAPLLIDVRTDKNSFNILKNKGIDIDQSMAVSIDDKLYAGGDAIHVLSYISTGNGFFNKMNKAIFASNTASRLLYPFMRGVRNGLLSFLNRTSIADNFERNENKEKHYDAFSIFSFTWSLFFFFNFFYLHFYELEQANHPINYLVFILSFCVMMMPRNVGLFSVMLVFQTVNSYMEMPIPSNHQIMEIFFLGGAMIAGLNCLIRGKDFISFFNMITPYGRSLLLIMYFFGIFHKINADFLNPETSCAVTLWRKFVLPEILHNHPFIQYSTIYGTYFVEGIIMLGLISKKFRYPGVITGLVFHFFLGLNYFAYYPAYSCLAFSLHTLFLPQNTLTNFRNSKSGKAFLENISVLRMSLLALLCLCAALLWFAAPSQNLQLVALSWTLLGAPLAIFIAIYSKNAVDEDYHFWGFAPFNSFLIIFTLFFLLNGFMPYLGLKTRQGINMFSNLHLEGGRSNHLVFQSPPGPFKYLEDTVEIVDVSQLNMEFPPDLQYVYYEFLNILSRLDQDDARLSYKRNGVLYENVRLGDLKPEMEKVLFPNWTKVYFHFSPIDFRNPRPCGNF